MATSTEHPWSFFQTQTPEAVIRTAQAMHEVALQTSYFAQAAHEIAMHQAETVAALQRISHSAMYQAFSTHPVLTTDLVRSVQASLSASGITAALETTQALRDIPVSQMQRLLGFWQPPYMPPFAACALSVNTSPVSESKQQIQPRKTARPRTRLIRRLAKQEFLQAAAVSLVLIQATSPEILEAVKEFTQTPACGDLLSLLSSSACIGAEYLSPKDRKTLLWVVWLFTVLFIFGK